MILTKNSKSEVHHLMINHQYRINNSISMASSRQTAQMCLIMPSKTSKITSRSLIAINFMSQWRLTTIKIFYKMMIIVPIWPRMSLENRSQTILDLRDTKPSSKQTIEMELKPTSFSMGECRSSLTNSRLIRPITIWTLCQCWMLLSLDINSIHNPMGSLDSTQMYLWCHMAFLTKTKWIQAIIQTKPILMKLREMNPSE